MPTLLERYATIKLQREGRGCGHFAPEPVGLYSHGIGPKSQDVIAASVLVRISRPDYF